MRLVQTSFFGRFVDWFGNVSGDHRPLTNARAGVLISSSALGDRRLNGETRDMIRDQPPETSWRTMSNTCPESLSRPTHSKHSEQDFIK